VFNRKKTCLRSNLAVSIDLVNIRNSEEFFNQ